MYKQPKTYAVYDRRFWTAYFVQMRPYLLFVSGIAGAFGLAIGESMAMPLWKILIAFIPFFLGYGFGQALTDCFQTDTDKISAPYRPLSKEIISTRSVMIISLSGLLASGLIFYWLHPVSFWLSLLVVFGLSTYSFVKKRFWFAGPFYNAWIVGLLPLMAYFAALNRSDSTFPWQLWPYLAVTFFSYANFVLIGYLKDIDADRQTNYNTFPVVFGWRRTMFVGDLFALACLCAFWMQSEKNNWELLFGIPGTIVIILGQVKGHLSKQQNEQEALMPILSTVRGFILLHISMLLHFTGSWWPYTFIFYLLFELALYTRPSKYQV